MSVTSKTINESTAVVGDQGDVLYFDGTDWVRLPAGEDGYVLTTHDVGADPTWEETVPGFTAGGDLSGTSTNQTVIKLQNRAVAATAPTDGYVLTWVNANSDWEPKPTSSNFGSQNITSTGAASIGSLTSTSVTSALVTISGKLIHQGIATSSTLSNADEGVIYFDSAANKFKISENGGAYTNLMNDGYFGSQNITTSGAVNTGTLTATSLNSALLTVSGKSIYQGIPTTSTLSNTDEGVIYFDSTLNKFRVSQNGDAFTDLVGGGFTAGGDLSGTSSSQNVIALKSATTSVNVGSATAPSSGQVLTATSSTAATWQTPSGGGGSSPPPIDGYTVALWQQTETSSATTWPNLATTGSIGTADLTASGVAPGNSSQFLPGAGGPFGYGSYTALSNTIGPSFTITYGIRGTGPSPSTSDTDWTADCYIKPTHTAQGTSTNGVIFGRRATTAATPTATSDWAFLLYHGAQHATGFQGWGFVVTFADGNTFRWSTAGGGSETIVAGGGAVAGTWALASNTWHHIGFRLAASGGNISYVAMYNGIAIAGGNAHTGLSTPKWLSASPEWVCLAGYNSAAYGCPQAVVTNCQLSNTNRPTSYFVDAAARIISQ